MKERRRRRRRRVRRAVTNKARIAGSEPF